MKKLMMAMWIAMALIFGASAAVPGKSWTCEKTGAKRHVHIIYPNAPDTLPCEVFYSKPNENVIPRQLWEANSTAGFCEEKAAELVHKLGSWGWLCTLDGAETPNHN